MRPILNVAAIAALAAAACPARADTVLLVNGQHLENVRVEEAGPQNFAIMRPGVRILIPRKEVLSIERSETPEETLARMIREAEGDPPRLAAAARFARVHSLGERAKEIDEMVEDARLERILAGVDRHDADALYAAAERALEARLPREAVDRTLRLALLANPEHERAHRALGEARFEGRWLPEAEVERREAERRAAEMRAKGLVFYEGAWVPPETKRIEEGRKELESELAAARKLRADLEAALAAANAREEALARREAALIERERMIAAREAALGWQGCYGPPPPACYGPTGVVVVGPYRPPVFVGPTPFVVRRR
jgi:hypothetical protein